MAKLPVLLKVGKARKPANEIVRARDRHADVLHYRNQHHAECDAGHNGFQHGRTHLSYERRCRSKHSSHSHINLPRPLLYRVNAHDFEDFPGLSGKRTRAKICDVLWQTTAELPTSFYTRRSAELLGLFGRWRGKVLPFPSSDPTVASPPCSSARCLTIASPRPVPPSSRERARSTR